MSRKDIAKPKSKEEYVGYVLVSATQRRCPLRSKNKLGLCTLAICEGEVEGVTSTGGVFVPKDEEHKGSSFGWVFRPCALSKGLVSSLSKAMNDHRKCKGPPVGRYSNVCFNKHAIFIPNELGRKIINDAITVHKVKRLLNQ